MEKLGGKCVFASEIDPNCQITYAQQFDMTVHGDINQCLNEIPKFDVLCAGFPCQTFSKAGKQEGFSDVIKGKLFFRIIDILKAHDECKFIILENVRNLADDEAFWSVIQNELRKLDFYITQDPIIKSPDYFGIPQTRERVYILGIKKSLRDETKLTNGWIHTNDLQLDNYMNPCMDGDAFKIIDLDNKTNKSYVISSQELKVINAWEEFKKNIIPHNEIAAPIWLDYFGMDETVSFDENNIPKWKMRFINNNRKLYHDHKAEIDAWYEEHKDCLTMKIYRKFEWNCGLNYTPFKNCIIQFRQSGLRVKRSNCFPSLVAIVNTPIIWDKKLKRYRRITVREAANLQCFDKDFKFVGSDKTCFKQLGNAVNVEVIRIITLRLFNLAIKDWDKTRGCNL